MSMNGLRSVPRRWYHWASRPLHGKLNLRHHERILNGACHSSSSSSSRRVADRPPMPSADALAVPSSFL